MTLRPGTRLGPYEVVELLGAGGMGEVYRARDPRLGRDVAVKVLPEEVAGDARRLGFFEREARAVAALNHPNILTVHDVGRHEGTPYVVTELLEGENFRELVSRRTPTVRQILAYALQAARGLEAAHAKDVVHRDLKPENLFLTTDGRVKVLDFGLAKLVRREEVHTDAPTPSRSTAVGQVVGTVAYMSPEQARGQPLDVRSDVFSFGVVLYELLAGKHPFKRDTAAATLTAIVDETPTALEGLGRGIPPAVGGIVRRCLEKATENRYGSGHDVAMVLEAVLAAPSEAVSLLEVEERSPYPGLNSFTEKDAGVFFGREREVEELWGRIRNRRLLAVIGPSGVGKTSFVRAGVIASRPEGWAAIVCTPGTQPFRTLGQALAPELAGDPDALRELLAFEETDTAVGLLTRWRGLHPEAVVVVDQFEELFTLNPPEVQGRFTALLGRLATEADVHVLLSLRDDFLMRCHGHETLAPVFSELTPLGALTAGGLERALVEPAKKQGYRFEDDPLVEEMVQAVEGARAALPLLAFAVSRLWEKRDRERKVLTGVAYEEIGGVAGALAQHAEATMDRIGSERQGLVREIFRNLVTAQGTRAIIDREELLSAFPDQEAAQEVLGQLIDARLLTSFEVEGKEDEPSQQRIEVVHESLLKAWPRLVRWQTLEEDSAQLRDQLRQAAHLWEEKGRTPDLLWSGTAFREFELWRERYAGRLTSLEEGFATAMVQRARRRRRIRRGALVAAFLVLGGVAATIAVSREQAVQSARRAEASKLLALAQLRLEEDPTEALAFTTASLELADTEEARTFTMRVLWAAPPALELETGSLAGANNLGFSPNGEYLAAAGVAEEARVWTETGQGPVLLPGHLVDTLGWNQPGWTSTGLLVTGPLRTQEHQEHRLHVWSLPDGKRVRTIVFGKSSQWQVGPKHLLAETIERDAAGREVHILRSWLLPDGEPEELGRVDWTALGASSSCFEPNGRSWLYSKGRAVYRRLLPVVEGAPDQLLVHHEGDVTLYGPYFSQPRRVFSLSRSGEIGIWASGETQPELVKLISKPEAAPESFFSDPSGRWVVGGDRRQARLWSTAAWPKARPLVLKRSGSWQYGDWSFDPRGDWYVMPTRETTRLTFWPVRRVYPTVVDVGTSGHNMIFSPDSRWLATPLADRTLRLWPLPGTGSQDVRTVNLPEWSWFGLAFAPRGEFLFAVGTGGRAYVAPLDGSPPRELEGFSTDRNLVPAAVSPSGGRIATASTYGAGTPRLAVWDLETGDRQLIDLTEASTAAGWGGAVFTVHFMDQDTLLTAGDGGVHRWNLETGATELVWATPPGEFAQIWVTSDGGRAVARRLDPGEGRRCHGVEILDLTSGTVEPLPAFGDCFAIGGVIGTAGTLVVTGDVEGVVRVDRLSGVEEPHLLLGHEGAVNHVAISPDLRWVASIGQDATLRLWPMPNLDKPPLHTLPHDELLAKLWSLTNLRAVRDAEAPNGWTIELAPFPGWRDVPEW